jgi:hypothetical protein
MPTLYLPQSMQEESRRDKAAMAAMIEEVESTLAEFNAELRKIDPYLRMIRALPVVSPESGLIANYYHVVRDEPNSPLFVTPLMWDNGEYREPGSWVFPYIQGQDMWNDRAQKDRQKRREAFKAAEQNRKNREAQARAAEFDDRLKHAENVHISVPRSIS